MGLTYRSSAPSNLLLVGDGYVWRTDAEDSPLSPPPHKTQIIIVQKVAILYIQMTWKVYC